MTGRSLLVIDVGGTNIKFAAIKEGRHLQETRQISTAELRQGDPVDNLARAILKMSAEFGVMPEVVVATVPGFLDTDRDLVRFAGNIPEFNGRRLASELKAKTGIRVVLERDSIMSLRGEWKSGAGRKVPLLLGLFFGTGVGGALLQDGIPYRGSGYALEIGQMPFKGEGRALEGMRTDCLEAYVSGRVLRSIADRHGVPVAEVFLRADGASALQVDIDAFVRDQAIAVGIAFSLFSPDAVLLGGGVCKMPGFPSERLIQLVKQNSTINESKAVLDFRWASLGWTAVLHGAELTAAMEAQRDLSGPAGTAGWRDRIRPDAIGEPTARTK